MVFYYLDPFVSHKNGVKELIPATVLHGQKTKPLFVSATGKTGIIIVNFYPWGVAPFTNIPFYELKDGAVDINFVFGIKTVGELYQKIIESKNNFERVNFIQKFLIKIISEKRKDDLVVALTKAINNNYKRIKISKLANELNLSRRHLLRRFSDSTGLSMKQFAGIIRFQKALYLKREGYHWGDIAENCGYFDQPHFIKEIERYTGTTPEKIFSNTKPTKLMQFFNSGYGMSHFYNTVYL
ncbi:MAG: hypothetical protein A2068_06960 [Ignavibacteria bacterium GWB2_35_6b]|nr:MAG: hypothetical protein A2068_06960 [Ignavibacteria bacterium GWB2_35_6b]